MNLAEKFREEASEFIKKNHPDSVSAEARVYKSKSKNAQEAHEAIRPTSAWRTPESVAPYLDDRQNKLYELIWRRAVASQMADAEIETTSATIATGTISAGRLP